MVFSISAPLTEINGSISNMQMNLKPGNYTAKAYHKTDAYYTEASNSVDFEIIDNVELLVNKTADVKVVGNNSVVNYTITVKNDGVCNASDVKIIDCLPENLTYSGDWGIIRSNGAKIEQVSDLEWIVSKITNGSDVSIWYKVTVNTNVAGNITNIVNVTCKENKTKVSDNESIEVVPVVLTVNKTVDVNLTGNNTEVTFKIVVNNTSRVNATSVKVVDELPEGLEYVTSTKDEDGMEFDISDDNRTLTWVISEMNDDPVELFVTVRTALVGNLTNNVTVTSKENDTPVKDNETVEVIPVVLTVNKTVDVNLTANNTEVTFKIVVNNTSKVNATVVKVVDVLPDGLVFVDATRDYGFSISDDNKTLTWTIDELTDSIELFVTVRTALVGNLTNNVTVTSKENDTPVKDNESVEVVPVILTVNKTANVTVVANDTFVTFKIVVTNAGEINATGVVVVDNLPEGLEYVKSSTVIDDIEYSFKPSSDKRTFTWTIPEFNGSIELLVTVKTTEYGDFTNNVTVTSKENDTPVKDNETIHVVPTNLTVVKTANVTNVSVGGLVEFTMNVTNNGLVEFTMNVTNNGLVEATNINVTDILDSAFEIQSIGNESYLKYNDSHKIVWNIPSLDAGNSTAVSVIVKVIKKVYYLMSLLLTAEKTQLKYLTKQMLPQYLLLI